MSLLLDLFHTSKHSKFRYLVLHIFITYETMHVASPKIHLSCTTSTIVSKLSFVLVSNEQNNLLRKRLSLYVTGFKRLIFFYIFSISLVQESTLFLYLWRVAEANLSSKSCTLTTVLGLMLSRINFQRITPSPISSPVELFVNRKISDSTMYSSKSFSGTLFLII